jgi:Tfp pilus assembly major pilin PilA
MQNAVQRVLRDQRGVSLSGLIVLLAVIGAVALVAIKVVPTWAEYSAAKDAIAKAKGSGGSVAEMKSSFSKNADINSIRSIGAQDLVFSKDSGETEISFAYEKRVPLAGNVSLVIDYAATTDKSGVVAATTASAE